MDSFAKNYLVVALVVFCCVLQTDARRRRQVVDPVMMAARRSGMVQSVSFEMEERGMTDGERPFALHHISRTLHRSVTPDGCLKAYTKSIRTGKRCPRNPNRPFRTIDGTCNNLENLGATNTLLARMVEPAVYEDGIGEPKRTGVSGNPLLSPRVISETLHPDIPDTTLLTILFMQFGQFIDHDVALSPLPTEGGNIITCCGENNVGLASPLPEECFPLEFENGDPDFNGTCMEFVRSEIAEEDYGKSEKVREQINALTSFVDASMVYGSEPELARELRTNNGTGMLLKTFDQDGESFLPKGDFPNCRIINNTEDDFCFLAGDIRVNEQPGLATIHTIFLRLHNVVARWLSRRRSRLTSEEVIYQIARKIVGAITQNILYGEWLPILLGANVTESLGLNTGNRSKYVPTLDPSTLQEFSTAAYRMGHSLVPSALVAGLDRLLLRDHFLLPRVVLERFDDIVEGLTLGNAFVWDVSNERFVANRARTFDRSVTSELTEHLFEVRERFGFDLVALNIQRGRDHGLSRYNEVRRKCGLPPITASSTFFQTSGLAEVYEDPEDVELFPGGLLEEPLNEGLLGPTFSCVISNQFFNLKFGDRYFFETTQRPEGFSNRGLRRIREVTMARVLCLTTNINSVQAAAFNIADRTSNPIVNCTDLLSGFWLSRN